MSTSSYFLPREILDRFDTSGPRYTSYPTSPEWSENFPVSDALRLIEENQQSRSNQELSLYVHVPFCHKLCWYCGCNMVVTRRQDIVERYLDAVIREITEVAGRIDPRREVVQIHWGGGTPTFLSPQQLARLFHALTKHFRLALDAEISIEVHPPVTTFEQLETLAALGFTRLSLGIQDFDANVQAAVNRIQPFEQTAALIECARSLGFISINTDLMYGLPRQTVFGFTRTLALVEQLKPDRLALFNYAHVPWLKPHQKLIKLADLPSREDKVTLLELAVNTLIDRGYRYIGLDHFALPSSELAIAQERRTLRRNFMGYTTCADSDVYAFGVSSISDLDSAYLQNAREVDEYIALSEVQTPPVRRGIVLSADDRLRREVINQIACQGRIDKVAIGRRYGIDFDRYFGAALARLQCFAECGIVTLSSDEITVTPRGRLLLRNVCMVFDSYLERPRTERRFSQTI